jgi:hypothetical protein
MISQDPDSGIYAMLRQARTLRDALDKLDKTAGGQKNQRNIKGIAIPGIKFRKTEGTKEIKQIYW